MTKPKCPDCEYHKQRAALWRAEAYKQAGHDVIERPEPVAFMYDFPNPNNPREDIVRDWVAQSMEEVERNHGFNVRPLYTDKGEQ